MNLISNPAFVGKWLVVRVASSVCPQRTRYGLTARKCSPFHAPVGGAHRDGPMSAFPRSDQLYEARHQPTGRLQAGTRAAAAPLLLIPRPDLRAQRLRSSLGSPTSSPSYPIIRPSGSTSCEFSRQLLYCVGAPGGPWLTQRVAQKCRWSMRRAGWSATRVGISASHAFRSISLSHSSRRRAFRPCLRLDADPGCLALPRLSIW